MSQMNGGVAWGGVPSPDRGPYVPIVRAVARGQVRAVILAHAAELVRVHYLDGRTVPHLEPAETCEHCETPYPPRLVAYLGGWLVAKCRWVLVEIPTQPTVEHYESLSGGNGSLRGLEIVLTRRGTAVNAPVVFTLHQWGGDTKALPEPPDVRAALCRLWGVKDPREGGG